ncbi:MAG TPA: hypothetical protein VGY55_17135 [Pirellulales bacterium]|jgi:hypothetical protein|nr:hypothetical protein [Pirellulales bacterium]
MSTANDLLRATDWRYRLAAKRVAERRGLPQRRWDSWTTNVGHYLLRRGACRRPSDLEALAKSFGALDVAHRIFVDADQTLRRVLEARLVTGAPSCEIATRIGLSATAVNRFEAVYFDVRSRLARPDFILGRLIRVTDARHYEWIDQGWKLIGYVAGSAALNSVLGGDRGQGAGRLNTLAREGLLMKTFVEAWIGANDRGGRSNSGGRNREILALLRDKDVLGERTDEFTANVERVFMNMPVHVLSRSEAEELRRTGPAIQVHPLVQYGIDHAEDFRSFDPQKELARRALRHSQAAEGKSPPPEAQPIQQSPKTYDWRTDDPF